MKVLVVNKYWHHAGGVETHMFQVVKLLEAKGHQVIPFAMSELTEPAVTDFPSYVDFRGTSGTGLFRALERSTTARESVSKLSAVVERESPDVAYVLHAYHQLGMRCLNVLRAAKIPVVLSLHDYKMSCANYRFFSEQSVDLCTKCFGKSAAERALNPAREKCWGGGRLAGVALAIESAYVSSRRSYLQPEIVTVLNELQRAAAREIGISPERIRMVRHPVPAPVEQRPELDRSRVLYVGRLVPEKGVDILIRAVAEVGVGLDVLGSGRDEDALRALSRELGADVQFHGSVHQAEVVQFLDRAVALVVPSVWHEVSPFVIYEAFSRMVPVVGSNLGGIPDLLKDGRGILVEPRSVSELSEAISLILQEGVSAKELADAAAQFARDQLSVQSWSNSILGCLEEAMASTDKRRDAS